jgi:hypothetical protein
MQPHWNRVHATIDKVVGRLASAGIARLSFRLLAYRDHTCDDVPLEMSDWTPDPKVLRTYAGSLVARGGGDLPESVHLALEQALAEPKLTALVLIGDAPPRPQHEGLTEASALGQAGRPVYAIPLAEPARGPFQQIAERSGGRLLDASNAADELAELIGLSIAHRAGRESLKRYVAGPALGPAAGRIAKRLLLEAGPGEGSRA